MFSGEGKASHISEVAYGKRKQAGGFKWEFLSDINHENARAIL